MIYVSALLIVLAAMWFALSSETSWLFLTLAAVSILSSLALALRLGTVDSEGSPYKRVFGLAMYFAWLGVEIVKANVTVIRTVVSPRRRVSPALVRVPMTERSGLARALFANSITLTPGTVTLDVHPGHLLVHALQEEGSHPSAFADMDRRSRRAADGGD